MIASDHEKTADRIASLEAELARAPEHKQGTQWYADRVRLLASLRNIQVRPAIFRPTDAHLYR